MKKNLLFCCLFFAALVSTAQSEEKKWNIGFHGGLTQYKGDIGNDFYRSDQASYGFAGLSVSRYLGKHFDASIFFTRGEVGYMDHNTVPTESKPNTFLIRNNTSNLLLRFNFTGPQAIIRPFIFIGAGVLWYEKVYEVKTEDFQFSIPSFGGG